MVENMEDKVLEKEQADALLDKEDTSDLLDKEKEEELSQEELDRMLAEDEAGRLKELGFPQFKTVDEMAENFKKFLDEDKMTFPIVKELASRYDMTPKDFILAVKTQLVKTTEKPESKDRTASPKVDEEIKRIKEETNETKWDMRFWRFQERKAKEEIEIPDSFMIPILTNAQLLVQTKTEEELKKIDIQSLLDEAYDLYLWQLDKEKNPDKIKEKYREFEVRKLVKLKQLGIPTGKKITRGYSSQDVQDYGEGITKL